MPNVVGFTIQASAGNSEQVLNQLKQSVGGLESALGSAGQVASGFFNSIAGGVAGGVLVADSLKKVGQAAADMAGSILDAGRALQDSTAQLQAWGNLTAEQASKVSQAFLNIGQPIEQSAAQLTQALANVIPQLEIINQGALSAGQAVAFMSAANDAAVATGQKLDDVTRGLSQSMLTFGISLSDAKEAAGTLVATSELTGSSIEQITTNIGRLHDRFGPLAPDLKDTASFLEELNQAGASGSRGLLVAATSVDHLLGSSKDVKLGLEELNISLDDGTGKIKGWGELFPEIVAKLSQETDGIKRARLENELFGGSWEALDQIIRRGTQGIADANGVVDDHSNFEQQAAIRANTFSGQLEILGKNAENVAAQLGGIVAGPGTEVLKWINDAIQGAGQLSSAFGSDIQGALKAVSDNFLGFNDVVKGTQELFDKLHIPDIPIPGWMDEVKKKLGDIAAAAKDVPPWVLALQGIPGTAAFGAFASFGASSAEERQKNLQQFPSSNQVIESSPDIKESTAAAKDNAEAFNRTTAQWIAFEEQLNPTASKLEAVNIAIAATSTAGTTNQAAIDGLAAEHDKLTAAATNSAEAATASAKAAEIGGRPLTAQAYKDLATALDSTNEKQIAGARAALTIAEAQDAANTKFGKEGVSAVNAYAEAQKQAANAVTSLATAQRQLDEAEGGRGVNTVPSRENVQTAADAVGPTKAVAEEKLQIQRDLTQKILADVAAGDLEQAKIDEAHLSSVKQDATEAANAYKQTVSDELTALHQLQAAESSRHDAAISEAQQERSARQEQLQFQTTVQQPNAPGVNAGLTAAHNAVLEVEKDLTTLNSVLERTDLTPAQRESFTNWKNERVKDLGEVEAKYQELQQIAQLPTQQEKDLSVDQSKLQLTQSIIKEKRDEVQLQRDINDQPLDKAILSATKLRDEFEASLQPLRNQKDVLESINTVLSDRAQLAQDIFTAGGSGVASAQLQLERDTAEANGTLTPELEKQFKLRSDALRVTQDQNQVTQAGFQQQEAAGRTEPDKLQIAIDTATANEKATTNIGGQLTVLGQQKQIHQDIYAIADQGNKIEDEKLTIYGEQLSILQQQYALIKQMAQPTQEQALALLNGQSGGANRITNGPGPGQTAAGGTLPGGSIGAVLAGGVPGNSVLGALTSSSTGGPHSFNGLEQAFGGVQRAPIPGYTGQLGYGGGIPFGQMPGQQGWSPATLPGYIGPPKTYPFDSTGKQSLTVNLQLNSASIGKAAADEIYHDLTLQVGTAP